MEQQQQNVAILRPGEVDQRMVQNGFKIAIFDKDVHKFQWSNCKIQYSTKNVHYFAKCHISFPTFFGCFSKINVPKDNPMPNNNPHPSPWEVDLRMVQNGHKLLKNDGSIIVLVNLLIYLLEKSGFDCTAHALKNKFVQNRLIKRWQNGCFW